MLYIVANQSLSNLWFLSVFLAYQLQASLSVGDKQHSNDKREPVFDCYCLKVAPFKNWQ